MSIETSKKKKGIQMPHTYIILFLIVLVVCLLTYVIPAGQFERQEDASGRMLIVPGTYTQVESSPVSPLEIPMAFVRTLGSSSVNEIIFFIFIIGGAFELIMQTGMITAFCAKLGKMFAGKEKLLIPIFITVFAVGGFTMGMSVEVLVFVPIGIAVAKAVGYDTITGTAMIAMGSIVGFTAGIYNPFNVGVAQSIAGVTPMFSGAWYRWIILVAFIVVTSLYIIHYAEKVKKNPSKNLMGNEDSNLEDVDVSAIEVTGRHKLILLAVVIALAVLFTAWPTWDGLSPKWLLCFWCWVWYAVFWPGVQRQQDLRSVCAGHGQYHLRCADCGSGRYDQYRYGGRHDH